ncbi:MAG: hypothetical protein LQ348_006111 [Seirophora lacunosa]|nr:MAG: hypothetical protein LQ344_005219 [Seirophora lacunosa]KAI4175722.1 MAG: hypothetical protein LQ348_006111 [Seirophora lacunosa]
MAHSSRLTNSGFRHPSLGPPSSNGQSPILLARISEKKAELENLKQLRDLSAGLAAQMQTLEEKLSTLSDGTEAVAVVLSNWHTVLQAINMASSTSRINRPPRTLSDLCAAGKLPKPKNAEGGDATTISSGTALPQTLVRIPAHQEPSHSTQQEVLSKET